MKYRANACAECGKMPVEPSELDFGPKTQVPITCQHCGAKLWAVGIGRGEGKPGTVEFRPRIEEDTTP